MPEFVAFSVVILLLLGGYWSMVVFPKQRAFKKHNVYVRTLGPGDEVITFGGIREDRGGRRGEGDHGLADSSLRARRRSAARPRRR